MTLRVNYFQVNVPRYETPSVRPTFHLSAQLHFFTFLNDSYGVNSAEGRRNLFQFYRTACDEISTLRGASRE